MHAYISLGSNLGHPDQQLKEAVLKIDKLSGVEITGKSKVYFTEPQGVKDQAWFSNQILQVICQPLWTAFSLLESLLAIEQQMGRIREVRWGPRCIDLDLLLYGQNVIVSERLIVPHPRIKERAFILIPLLDIDPDLVFPDGETPVQALERLDYKRDQQTIWQA
jgi:2-amino-4-hydroxy-6-hydroxymethyldihydropteridine diphosphokinase